MDMGKQVIGLVSVSA